MRSVVLCEGRDDLRFLVYYLKHRGWEDCLPWKDYAPRIRERVQESSYVQKGGDTALIWSVGGKDAFQEPASRVVQEGALNSPPTPVDSLVIMGDRDEGSLDTALQTMAEWVRPIPVKLENGKPFKYTYTSLDEQDRCLCITPLLVPTDVEGATETVLMQAVASQSPAGKIVVQEARDYVDRLHGMPKLRRHTSTTIALS